MSTELYTDAINQVTAIDCTFDRDTVKVGAIYLEPETPCDKIRLSNGTHSFWIHLPEDLLHNPEPCCAWNLRFDITQAGNEEVPLLPAEPPADSPSPVQSYPLSAYPR